MPKITSLQREAAKAIARDALVLLENYIIDLTYAAHNEPNDIGNSREKLLDACFDIIELADDAGK